MKNFKKRKEKGIVGLTFRSIMDGDFT